MTEFLDKRDFFGFIKGCMGSASDGQKKQTTSQRLPDIKFNSGFNLLNYSFN